MTDLSNIRFGDRFKIDGEGTPVVLRKYYRSANGSDDHRYGLVVMEQCDPHANTDAETLIPIELSRLIPIAHTPPSTRSRQ